MPTVSHDDGVVEDFREDPAYALGLLNSVLEDGDSGELLIALRQLTQAFGGVPAVAEIADLNPTQLYRTLSADGNPTLNSLIAVLKAMKLQLMVRPLNEEKLNQKKQRQAKPRSKAVASSPKAVASAR